MLDGVPVPTGWRCRDRPDLGHVGGPTAVRGGPTLVQRSDSRIAKPPRPGAFVVGATGFEPVASTV